MPLSCSIITLNEGDRIEHCIRAVQGIADDIVVVDSGSSDDTVAKAQSLGARVFFHQWDGYGLQKRFAEDMARHDWILNLDADEVITSELADEIAALLRTSEPPLAAYRVRLVTVYPGHDRPRLWANEHNQVRLYDRRRVRFSESRVHDSVVTGNHPVGQLRAIALHRSLRTIDHLRVKLDSYTDLQATELRKPLWALVGRLPFEYPIVFLRYYFLRTHFTGGLTGLRIAHEIARSRVRRLVKILRHRRVPNQARPARGH